MIDRYRDEFKRRGVRPPTALLLIYFLLILGATIVGIKAVIEVSESDHVMSFLMITSCLIIFTVILANGHRVMCRMMNRLNRVQSIDPVFHTSEMLLAWAYTREEWDR